MSSQGIRLYDRNETIGVAFLSAAGFISLLSILYIILTHKLKTMRKYNMAHIYSHFILLLVANSLQAIGTIVNVYWANRSGIESGPICTAQGAIKQVGNLSSALLTATISLHLFALLFLRINFSALFFGLAMAFIWSLVLFLVTIGPGVLQTAERGPYFGISGAWCWITDEYQTERILLEYFVEYLAAGICFVFYICILLRVRGNLFRSHGQWHLRNLKKEEAWKLSIGRDLIDSNMLKVAQSMVWYPVAYTLVIAPITLARFPEFFGVAVPFPITVLTSVIFNLNGLINVVLLLWTRKYFPTNDTIPTFGTKRTHISVSLHETGGLIPFTLGTSAEAEVYEKTKMYRHVRRAGSPSSSFGGSRSPSPSPGHYGYLTPTSSFGSIPSTISLPPRTLSPRSSSLPKNDFYL